MAKRTQHVQTGAIFVQTSAQRRNGRVRFSTREVRHKKLWASLSSLNRQTPQGNSSEDSKLSKPKIDSLKSNPTAKLESIESYPEPVFDGWAGEADDVFDVNHKTQHDFVREWIPKIEDYLRTIITREAHPNNGACSQCPSPEGFWKCLDCTGTPALCRQCCRDKHAWNPFHRVQFWTGTCYKQDWLYNLGVTIHLGHHGSPCSSFPMTIESRPIPQDIDHPRKIDIYTSPSCNRDHPSGAELFTIGHPNGVHKVWVRYCQCASAEPDDLQLLSSGLFPLSFQNCRSAFTFAMLDDFRQHNLICKVSSYFYYKKLRRLTHPWFFHAVPNRYKELRRVYKQWRHLMHKMVAGTLYAPDGSLALFCAACPQEGINIPETWKADEEQLAYTRSFVMDGNFSAGHLRQREVSTEPWLSDGTMFLARRSEFDPYIQMATEEKEVPTCNKHHAVNDRLITHKGRDITGIGSTACARHGAFCPGSTVNFQKGERQVNMDFSLCSAVANTHVGSLPNLIMLYDINCQYNVNFEKRIEKNPGIIFPFEKNLYWGIGEFHVTAHVPRCFPRHSPQFIQGAGCVDGEILETLWSLLKDVFPGTQTSTLASRAETLNDHMQENNKEKILGIVDSTVNKYKAASKSIKGAAKSFKDLTKIVQRKWPESLREWEALAKAADTERLKDPAAMDIYETTFEVKPSRSRRQHEEMEEENRTGQNVGATEWLAEGIKLQELQHTIRVMGKKSYETDAQKTDLARRRQQLQNRLMKFHDTAENFIPGNGPELSFSGSVNDWLEDDYGGESDDEELIYIPDGKTKKTRHAPILDSPRKRKRPDPATDRTLAENVDIVLPSTLGIGLCTSLKLLPLVTKELKLREGQANDALAAIRLAIGEKSFLILNHIRAVKSKKQKTRSWSAYRKACRTLRSNEWVYKKARDAMLALGASQETMAEYRVLTEDDVRTITSIAVPNAPGQKGKPLSWIFTTGSAYNGQTENTDESQIITELLRVNWLRSRANYLRCKEQTSVTQHEMVWSVRYFLYHSKKWRKQAGEAAPNMRAYAVGQAEMWLELAAHADAVYKKECPSFTNTFGYIKVSSI